MDRLQTVGQVALVVVLLAGALALGYGALGMICEKAFIVASAG